MNKETKLINDVNLINWIAETIDPEEFAKSNYSKLKNSKCQVQYLVLKLLLQQKTQKELSQSTKLALDSFERAELLLRIKQLMRRGAINCYSNKENDKKLEISDITNESIDIGFNIEITDLGIELVQYNT